MDGNTSVQIDSIYGYNKIVVAAEDLCIACKLAIGQANATGQVAQKCVLKVLPPGRFEGFALYSVPYIKTSMENLNKTYYGTDLVPEKTLKIVTGQGAALWHNCLGWQDQDTIVLSAGLGKDFEKFTYNIDTNKLTGYPHWKALVTHAQYLSAK